MEHLVSEVDQRLEAGGHAHGAEHAVHHFFEADRGMRHRVEELAPCESVLLLRPVGVLHVLQQNTQEDQPALHGQAWACRLQHVVDHHAKAP
ncbi:hypothetical protein D3C71_1994950 [compost metagenome]